VRKLVDKSTNRGKGNCQPSYLSVTTQASVRAE
jgi:hypothetical protein